MRGPCCNAVDVDNRHARICPRAGAQVTQHHPLLHAISRTLTRFGIPHQVESGEPFTADKNLRMELAIRKEEVFGTLRTGSTETSPSRLGVTNADPQTQVHLRGGSADHNESAASTSEARERPRYDHPKYVSFDKRSHKFATSAVESFGRLGVEASNFIERLETTSSATGGRDGGPMVRKRVVKKRLLQIVWVTAQVAISRRVSRFKLQLRGR